MDYGNAPIASRRRHINIQPAAEVGTDRLAVGRVDRFLLVILTLAERLLVCLVIFVLGPFLCRGKSGQVLCVNTAGVLILFALVSLFEPLRQHQRIIHLAQRSIPLGRIHLSRQSRNNQLPQDLRGVVVELFCPFIVKAVEHRIFEIILLKHDLERGFVDIRLVLCLTDHNLARHDPGPGNGRDLHILHAVQRFCFLVQFIPVCFAFRRCRSGKPRHILLQLQICLKQDLAKVCLFNIRVDDVAGSIGPEVHPEHAVGKG
ncbi:MAG: hypothetical protein KBC23_04120 [Candidatus Omnitrophica bacterium]|nr:hypothetical protein [Candidatus Omnitrophota bacterium]